MEESKVVEEGRGTKSESKNGSSSSRDTNYLVGTPTGVFAG